MSESTYLIPIECKGDSADVLIYQQIGNSFFEEGITAKAFADELRQYKGVKTINVRINSPGGNVFDATAIFNTLRNHGAKVVTHIEGAALSAASLIAMAGDEIRMAANGYLMIHDPSSAVRGKAEDMRKHADMLDRVKATLVATYATRTKQPADTIAKMMSAETWLGADEAKAQGFADTVAESSAVVATFDPQQFTNVPQELRISLQKETKPMAEAPQTPKAATVQELKAACPNADAVFLMAQLEASATVEAAGKAWMTELTNRIAAKDAELAQAKAAKPAAPVVPAPTAGVEPLPAGGGKPAASGSGAEGDPIAEFEEAVAAQVKLGKPRHAAQAIVCRKNPELREAMLAAHNAQHKPARR
jgi:ATP-dependent Clp protease protease subunit